MTVTGRAAAEQAASSSAAPAPAPTFPGLPEAPRAAHWVGPDLVAWRATGGGKASVALRVSYTAGLDEADVTEFPLERVEGGLPAEVRARFPHLRGSACFRLAAGLLPDEVLDLALRSQVVAVAKDRDGAFLAHTGVQTSGVLDACRRFDGPLGPRVLPDGRVEVTVWAPTAQEVVLEVFPTADGPESVLVPMERGDRGEWAAQGPAEWLGRFYAFRSRCYHPTTGRVEALVVTDPYSRSLSCDGRRSQFVDVDDPSLKPEGWDALEKPALHSHVDASIYELHVRDFSAEDATVPAGRQGKFEAFCELGSDGVRHLKRLQAAGLTHIHLLPVYDFGSVPERETDQRVAEVAGGFAPDSDEPQARVLAVAGEYMRPPRQVGGAEG